METLGYEVALYPPIVGGHGIDLVRQLRAAAAVGFDWFALDS